MSAYCWGAADTIFDVIVGSHENEFDNDIEKSKSSKKTKPVECRLLPFIYLILNRKSDSCLDYVSLRIYNSYNSKIYYYKISYSFMLSL